MTRDRTFAVVDDIRYRTGPRTVAHLTRVGTKRTEPTGLANELTEPGRRCPLGPLNPA